MTTEYFALLIEQAQIDEAKRMGTIRSHIYAYKPIGGGYFEPVPDESVVVSDVINQLADVTFVPCNRLLELISSEYRTSIPQVRNRSGRLWTPASLAALVKPIYCGMQQGRFGLERIHNYPPIVERKKFEAAILRLRRQGFVE